MPKGGKRLGAGRPASQTKATRAQIMLTGRLADLWTAADSPTRDRVRDAIELALSSDRRYVSKGL